MTAFFDLQLNAEAEFLALSVEGQDFRRMVFRLADSHSFTVCKSSTAALVFSTLAG